MLQPGQSAAQTGHDQFGFHLQDDKAGQAEAVSFSDAIAPAVAEQQSTLDVGKRDLLMVAHINQHWQG